MTTLVPLDLLSGPTQIRTQMCGLPLVLRRESGELAETRFACGSSWCRYCANVKRLHVADRIRERCSESPVMLTLTLPPLHSYLRAANLRPLSEAALRAQLDAVRSCWSNASGRIRWALHHERRGDFDAAAATLPPPGRPDPHPEYTSTWDADAEQWEPLAGGWACIWAREVTTGARGEHWHWHIHVLLPSRAHAERLNAAWQAAAAELGFVGRGRWTRSDILEACREDIARYLAKGPTAPLDAGAAMSRYLSKHEAQALSKRQQRAYVRGTHNARRWDAQGDWRPLGVGMLAEREDPAVSIWAIGEWDAQHYAGLNIPIAEFYSGKSPWYSWASCNLERLEHGRVGPALRYVRYRPERDETDHLRKPPNRAPPS